MWQSLSKIKNLASSIHDKERKCTNKKVVLEKKKPKSRSNELCVNLFFDAVQPNLHSCQVRKIDDKRILNICFRTYLALKFEKSPTGDFFKILWPSHNF